MTRWFPALLLGLVTLTALPAHATTALVFDHEWGSFGSAPGQFNFPYDVAEGPSGEIVIADFRNDRIQKFDADGNFVLAFGGNGTANGQFKRPNAVAVDGDGNIIVSDWQNYRIQKFDPAGNFLAAWGSYGPGTTGFAGVYDVAVDSQGNVYVADAYLLSKFDPSGAYLGAAPLAFAVNAVTIDDSDVLYTPLLLGDGTSTYDRRDPSLTVLGPFTLTVPGEPTAGLHGWYNARHDRFVVAAGDMMYGARSRLFDLSGNYLGEFGDYGSGEGQMLNPLSAMPTADGGVVVCDVYRSVVLKFRPAAVPAVPTTWGRIKHEHR